MQFSVVYQRVGHGLDSSMDWIGLVWIGLGQNFCPLHCFSENGSAPPSSSVFFR